MRNEKVTHCVANLKMDMNEIQETKRTDALFERIAALVEQSRQFVAYSVK